jgi:hypothetical protein
MGAVHDLSERLNVWVENIEQNIRESVLFVEKEINDINREQLRIYQINAEGMSTPEYSSKWKSIKGLTYWNVFQTGKTQNSLKILTTKDQYMITPQYKPHMEILERRGFDTKMFFGIAPENQDKAKRITSKSIAMNLRSKVFKGN